MFKYHQGLTLVRNIASISFLALLVGNSALAQPYPNRPLRLIAAQSAGSSLDTIARIVTPRLSELLGQQIVIDNRGGAGGIIGIELAARANINYLARFDCAPVALCSARTENFNNPLNVHS